VTAIFLLTDSSGKARQQTAPAVMARASVAAFPLAMHGPRRPPPS
jgi:hypothetical protein